MAKTGRSESLGEAAGISEVHRWIDDRRALDEKIASNPSEIIDTEIGHATQLFQECLRGLIQIQHYIRGGAVPFSSPAVNAGLNDCLERLRLWGDVFVDGKLESCLKTSPELQERVLEILSQIGKALLTVLSQVVHNDSAISKVVLDVICELRSLLDRASSEAPLEHSCVDGAPDSGSDSSDEEGTNMRSSTKPVDIDVSSLNQQKALQAFLRILAIRTRLLMDLCPTFDHVYSKITRGLGVGARPSMTSFHVTEAAWQYVRQILDKFPHAGLALAERLGEANWQRYNNLREEANPEEISVTVSAQEHAVPKSSFRPVSQFHDSGIGNSLPATSHAVSSQASYTSFLSSIADKGRLRVPKMPEAVELGQPFDCYICGFRQSKIRTRIDWKLHVFADLKPYICTFNNCRDQLITFPSRKLWSEHEFTKHRLYNNNFYKCHECEQTLLTEAAFTSHLSKSHTVQDISRTHMESLIAAARFQTSQPLNEQACPLCNQTNWVLKRDFVKHLGQHMEEIALITLPPPDDASESETDKEGSSLLDVDSIKSQRSNSSEVIANNQNSADEVDATLLLAAAGVDPDSRDDGIGRTKLWRAAANGHEAVVRLLLTTNKIDPDFKDGDGRTPLSWAAHNGREEVVKLLLALPEVDPNSKDDHGWTPLRWAAQKGHEAVVKLLLARPEVDPDSKDADGWTSLWRATQIGHEAVVKLLLARPEVDPDPKDADGWTPLRWAAQEGYEAVVRLLLATNKVDPDSKDAEGRTPLRRATQNGHEGVVKLLLAQPEVNPDLKDEHGWTPLRWAAWGGHEAVVKLLLARPEVDPDPKDAEGWTPLRWAAEEGHEAVVKLLLARPEVDPDSRDADGRTPLRWAAQEGHEAVVKLLLARPEVDPDSKDADGWTPLWWAAQNGHERVVKLLLARPEVDPDSKDTAGRTLLWWAAQKGYEAVVKLLLARPEVDPESKDNHDRTPLSRAAQYGHEAVVKLLLARPEVNPDSEENDSRTPLSRAARHGHEAVVKLLLARPEVDPDSNDVYGWTPLLKAAQNRHEAVVQMLLATNKINLDSKDADGVTPLWWAAQNGYDVLVKLLLARPEVDPDSKDTAGRTLLWWAAQYGHEAVVKLLLARPEVNPGSEDNDSRTPLSRAAAHGHEAVVKLLLARPEVDVNQVGEDGRTPLFEAAFEGHETVVKLLLATNKVSLDSEDTNGRTALWWAMRREHEAVVKLLRLNGDLSS